MNKFFLILSITLGDRLGSKLIDYVEKQIVISQQMQKKSQTRNVLFKNLVNCKKKIKTRIQNKRQNV